MSRHVLLSLPLCMLAGGLSAQTVLNATDLATLRTHIASANAGTGDYTINIAAGTYTLTGTAGDASPATGDLDITRATAGNIILSGAGAATTFIDANSVDRVFHINAGASVTVTFQNLTIRNGRAVDNGTAATEARGGGIYIQSATNVTLTGVVLNNNQAVGANGANGAVGATGVSQGGSGGVGTAGSPARGGAIYMTGGTLTINTTTLSGDTTKGGNGGIGGAGGAASSVYTCTGGPGGSGGAGGASEGGGIYAVGGTLNVSASTLSGCGVTGGNGGAGGKGGNGGGSASYTYLVAHGGAGAQGGQGGASSGGGVFVTAGTINITNSTISGDTTLGGNGGAGGAGGNGTGVSVGSVVYNYGGNGGSGGASGNPRGGGMYTTAGTITINNTTLTLGVATAGTGGAAGNGGTGASGAGSSGTAGAATASSGGGLAIVGGAVTANSTIFADSNATTGKDVTGSLTAGASLFETVPTGTLTPGTGANVTNQDPVLSALASNGGPTQTRALPASGSPALNAGSNPLALTTDQRGAGFARSSGTGVDMGAFEYPATPPPAAPTVTDPATALNASSSSYNIQGSAPANVLVRIYNDANNNNIIDAGETVVASQQLTGGGTAFSISTPLTASSPNNFLATSYNGSLESSPTDVPTITQIPAPNPPTVTDPAAGITLNALSYNIQGTAPANLLVRIYTDLNNDGIINGADAVVATQQLTGGATAFSIATPLTQDAANNFLATAFNGTLESSPTNVPTITEDSTAPAAPVVTNPASAVSLVGATYNIQGTAEANALVKVYRDLNNNGTRDTGEPMLVQSQLTGGATAWNIAAPLIASSANEFVVTATDGAANEGVAANVATITENTIAPVATPSVTTPAAAVTVNQANFTIIGSAQADTLVRVYTDANNDGMVNGTDAAVGSQQLTGGATAFSITVPLAQNTANNFTVTATDSVPTQSNPRDVPTITDDAGFSSGTGTGTGGGGGGCAADPVAQGPWMLALGAIGAMLLALRSWLVRRA